MARRRPVGGASPHRRATHKFTQQQVRDAQKDEYKSGMYRTKGQYDYQRRSAKIGEAVQYAGYRNTVPPELRTAKNAVDFLLGITATGEANERRKKARADFLDFVEEIDYDYYEGEYGQWDWDVYDDDVSSDTR